MRKINWGIISTANIAQTQLIPALFRADNAEAAAIASRDRKVHEVAAKLKIPKAYESYEKLIEDPEIDAVYIPLPNHLHKEWVFKAAKQGKHVLCEKPIALNEKDASEMVEFCAKQNVKLMEAFMYQLHPQHQRVKEIISSGEIGEVNLIKSSFSFFLEDRANIRMDKTMGGGSLYDVGCYSIHVIRYLLESEPVKVYAQSNDDPATGVDMTAFGKLTMSNGVDAVFDSSFEMAYRNEYEVIGTKGTIHVPYAFRPDVNKGIGHVIVNSDGVSRNETIAGDIYRLEVEHCSQAILEDSKPILSGESVINNMRVIDACYESIRTGKTIIL